jgi:hypothetical protein
MLIEHARDRRNFIYRCGSDPLLYIIDGLSRNSYGISKLLLIQATFLPPNLDLSSQLFFPFHVNIFTLLVKYVNIFAYFPHGRRIFWKGWGGDMLNRVDNPGESLSLALSARRAIKSLIALESDGQEDKALEAAGNDVVQALEAFNSDGPLFAHLASPSICENYDQIQILDEVRNAIGDADYTEKLLSATAGKGQDHEARRRNIEFTIRFFTAVERRALQTYNQASNPSF